MKQIMIPLSLVALLITGCNEIDDKTLSCNENIPTVASFIQDPAYASLHYHVRIPYNLDLKKGYDMWGDSKFEYKTGLQFDFIPTDARVSNVHCYNRVALMERLPLNAAQKEMLNAFDKKVSGVMGLNAQEVQTKIETLLENQSSITQLSDSKNVTLVAGVMHHQFRGDFLMVTIQAK